MRNQEEEQRSHAKNFLSLLDNYIARTARLFLEPAYNIGIANCNAIVGDGSKSIVIYQVIDGVSDDAEAEEAGDNAVGSARSVKGGDLEPTNEFLQTRTLTCDSWTGAR